MSTLIPKFDFKNGGTTPVGAVNRPINEKLAQTISVKDYGAVGNGVTDDYAAIMAAHDNAPVGSTIYIEGACKFTQPLVFTRSLNWICPSLSDYLLPALSSGTALSIGDPNPPLTTGSLLAYLSFKINMFGPDNCCTNGIVFTRLFHSSVEANILVGATSYGYKVMGCENNYFSLICSGNFAIPTAPSVGLPPNHLLIDNSGIYGSNVNIFHVIFEGSINGVLINNQAQQGDNTFYGTIEGLSGTPFSATGCFNLKLTQMHFESNALACSFITCSSLAIENIINATSPAFVLYDCIETLVKNYTGGLAITAQATFTKVINCTLDSNTYSDLSETTELIGGGIKSTGSAVTLTGGGGTTIPENLFVNPFVDIWPNGSASAPAGFSAVAATFAKSTSVYYSLSQSKTSVAVTSTATIADNCVRMTPIAPYVQTSGQRWVSVTIPVYVATGQPNVIIYVFIGTGYEGIYTVTEKDTWVICRGSVLVNAGAYPFVTVVPYTTSVVAGDFYIGGCNIVTGTTAPKYLIDSGKRENYVVDNVGYAPTFVGQKAYASGTGKWYLAANTTANTDWIILN